MSDFYKIAESSEILGGAYIPTGKVRIEHEAKVYTDASIGLWSVVGRICSIMTGAMIGAESNIGPGCFIGYHAFIGRSAEIGRSACICEDVWVGSNVVVGARAHIGSGARITRPTDIFHYGPVGSENRYVTMYRTHTGEEMLNVGCWSGTLDELEARIKLDGNHGWGPYHGWSPESAPLHHAGYTAFINACRSHLSVNNWVTDRPMTPDEEIDKASWDEHCKAIGIAVEESEPSRPEVGDRVCSGGMIGYIYKDDGGSFLPFRLTTEPAGQGYYLGRWAAENTTVIGEEIAVSYYDGKFHVVGPGGRDHYVDQDEARAQAVCDYLNAQEAQS